MPAFAVAGLRPALMRRRHREKMSLGGMFDRLIFRGGAFALAARSAARERRWLRVSV